MRRGGAARAAPPHASLLHRYLVVDHAEIHALPSSHDARDDVAPHRDSVQAAHVDDGVAPSLPVLERSEDVSAVEGFLKEEPEKRLAFLLAERLKLDQPEQAFKVLLKEKLSSLVRSMALLSLLMRKVGLSWPLPRTMAALLWASCVSVYTVGRALGHRSPDGRGLLGDDNFRGTVQFGRARGRCEPPRGG